MKKKFAIILSGCGFQDGSEIHEAVLSLLAIDRLGHSYQCFAPDIHQHTVVDHLTGETVQEKRNVLSESARIARGKIKPLSDFNADQVDILLFPGGFGAASNLCTFASDGADCTVNSEVESAVQDMRASKKPIGALCIAPVILGKLLKDASLTVGQDKKVNAALGQMGCKTQDTGPEEVVVDKENLIVTGPCYMLDSTITEIANGAHNVIDALIKLSGT